MGEVRMTGELRTDYDLEITGVPSRRYGEAVFKIDDEEIVLEISLEDKTIVSLMAGEDAVWKGTLEGMKQLLRGEIKGR